MSLDKIAKAENLTTMLEIRFNEYKKETGLLESIASDVKTKVSNQILIF